MTYNADNMRELRARRRHERPRTLRESLRRQIVADHELSRQIQFPCTQFQTDLEGFARQVLGIRPTNKQRALFAVVLRMVAGDADAGDLKRALVKSCVKSGKTFLIAVLALWRYACWADSRTLLTGPGERSVQKLAWREVRKMHARSGVCYDCRSTLGVATCEHSARIPGECSLQARTGLTGLGFSEVFGLVAAVDVNLQGFSDPTLVIIGDEAVAIRGELYDALHGNMASSVSGFEMWFSNPNKLGNWFHDGFNKNAARWLLETISGFDICDEGVPGLIKRSFLVELEKDYGVDGDAYLIRGLGEFPQRAGGGLFTEQLLSGALSRWQLTREGMRVIGVDPATSDDNDAAAFAVRVGLSIQHIGLEYGLDVPALWQHVEGLILEYCRGEPVAVCVDASGIGYELCAHARIKCKDRPIQLIQMRGSDNAMRKPQIYRRVRDELVDALREFLRDGGELPPGESEYAIEEARCFAFGEGDRGLLQATRKILIRRQLGRSPDSFDACCLAAWPKTVATRRVRSSSARSGMPSDAANIPGQLARDRMARLKAGAVAVRRRY